MQCALCGDDVSDAIRCGSCENNIGYCCANQTEQEYRKLSASRKAAWKCLKCKKPTPTTSKATDLDSIMVKLNQMEVHLACLPGLVKDVKDIKLELAEVKNSCESNSANLTKCTLRLDEVEKKIPDLEANNVKINSLSQQLAQLKSEITNRDQWYRLNNLEVKGVPLKNNENLFTIMKHIGEIVGFPIQSNSINYISRIPVHNSKEKSIIVSFVNRYIKENFIASARLRKTISAEELGFKDCHNKIFVNDHLTPDYKMLLTKTKTELKSKNYKYVWVKFAKIHVRKDDNSKVHVINNESDLNRLL